MRKVATFLFVLLLCGFALIVFDENYVCTAASIASPTNLKVLVNADKKIVASWSNVEGNEGYVLEVDKVEYVVGKNVLQLDLTEICLSVRPYNIRIKTLGVGDTCSEYSAIVVLELAKSIATPSNLAVSSGELSWAKCENASYYEVVINGVSIARPTDTKFNLTNILTNVGDYDIRVCAHGDNYKYLDSAYSSSFIYTNKIALDMPINLFVAPDDNATILSWTKVPYASDYEVTIDNTVLSCSSNQINILNYLSDVKDYNISVKAKAHDNFLESSTNHIVYKLKKGLAAPTLSVLGEKVSWQAVPNARSYTVKINNTLCADEFVGTEFDFSSFVTAVGNYKIKVSANGNGNYLASDIVEYSYNKFIKLSAPSAVINGSIVSWTAVPNAIFYSIFIDGVLKDANHSTTSLDISSYCAEAKNYRIEVLANANGYYSESDKSLVAYNHTVKQQTVVLSVEGKVVSWLQIFSADSYSITLDGVIVENAYTQLSIDLTTIMTEKKVYEVGVFANAKDGLLDGAPSIVRIENKDAGKISVPTSTKTYKLIGYEQNANNLVYLDGVRTDKKITNDGLITLSEDVKTIDIVQNCETITENDIVTYYQTIVTSNAVGVNGTYEYILTKTTSTAVFCNVLGNARDSVVSFNQGEKIYSYHYLSEDGYYPSEVLC